MDAQGHWLSKHYPRHRKTAQALISRDGKKYDEITLVSPDGAMKKVYFDITSCFGF